MRQDWKTIRGAAGELVTRNVLIGRVSRGMTFTVRSEVWGREILPLRSFNAKRENEVIC